jgi:hypothetical protein
MPVILATWEAETARIADEIDNKDPLKSCECQVQMAHVYHPSYLEAQTRRTLVPG